MIVKKPRKRISASDKNWLIPNISKLSKAERSRHIENEFSKAKRFSDLIGMIVRLSFAVFAATYFAKRMIQAEDFARWAFATCSLFALILGGLLGGHMLMLLFLYETRDMHLHKTKTMKTASILISIFLIGLIMYGIWDLVSMLATASLPK